MSEVTLYPSTQSILKKSHLPELAKLVSPPGVYVCACV